MLVGRRGQPRGFTLVDLLIVIGALAVLGTLLLLWLPGRGDNDLRFQNQCTYNLSAIGKAIVMYSATTSDEYPFPLLRSSGDPNVAVNAATAADDIWSPNLGSNGMQNVWLLLKENLVGPTSFHCPADKTWTPRETAAKYGWTAPTQFSYGVHFPYDKDAAGAESAAKLSDANLAPALVIFADRNPGGSVNAQRIPSNHPRWSGESILKKDSSVTFYKSSADSKCGAKGDDIYVNTAGLAGGVPIDPKDKELAGTDTSITPVPSK
jgi:hypothetical protein